MIFFPKEARVERGLDPSPWYYGEVMEHSEVKALQRKVGHWGMSLELILGPWFLSVSLFVS